MASHLGRLAGVYYTSINACSYGLSLFFTLSAFLICELLVREKESTGKVDAKRFYIRRILRIWPVYYLALGAGVIAALLAGNSADSLRQIGWYAIFLGAWSSAHFGWIQNPISPLWSISVEEQFYAVVPWVLKWLNRGRVYLFCVVVLVCSDAWLIHLGRTGASNVALWCSSVAQFQCFAAGILLSLALKGRLPTLLLWQRALLVAGAWLCWCLATEVGESRAASLFGVAWGAVVQYTLASIGSVMALIAFLGADSRLLPRWLIYLGRISYGLYAVHGFAVGLAAKPFPERGLSATMLALRICAGFGLTVLVAAFLYRFFERPFLKLKERAAPIVTQPYLV